MEEVQKRGDAKPSFDYEQVDEKMAEFLRKKESNIRKTGEKVGEGLTEWGRDLKEARDRLSGNNQYNGFFIKWCEFVGFHRKTALRLIQRYEMLGTLCPDQQDIIEELPPTLTYEIAKPSAESTEPKRQAKQAVLNGEVKTLKEYRKLEERLQKEKEARQTAERKLGLAEHEADILRDTLESVEDKEPEYVEVDKTDPSVIERLKKYEEKFGNLDEPIPSERPYGVKLSDEIYGAIDSLSEWQKKYSWILTDLEEFRLLVEANSDFAREFNRIDKFWKQLSYAFNQVEQKGVYNKQVEKDNIIDGEFTEII